MKGARDGALGSSIFMRLMREKDVGRNCREGEAMEVKGNPGERDAVEANRRGSPGAGWLRGSKSAKSSKTMCEGTFGKSEG